LFSLDPVSTSSTAHARFFNPTVGIVEDSATGTAAGPLACQLVRHGIVKEGSPITIEQGYEMRRPSLLRLEVHGDSALVELERVAGLGTKELKLHPNTQNFDVSDPNVAKVVDKYELSLAVLFDSYTGYSEGKSP
jgi:predicted PhzF superfamily epimerase YddE/YHI9